MFKNNVIKIVPVFLLLIALFFSTYKLTESPPVWYDEGIILQPAINLARLGGMFVQISPSEQISAQFISTGYTVIYPISLVFKYFGISLLNARLIMLVYLIVFVCASFLLAQRIFGFKYASLGTLLLVSFPPLYGNGKNVLGEVPGLLFLILFLYFINKIEHNYKKTFYYILAGVFSGLCVVTKPLFLVLLGAVFLSIILFRRKIDFYWQKICLGILSFFIPFFVWVSTQFKGSEVLSDVFGYYSNPYGIKDIWSQIFINLGRFFTELTPTYFLGLFIIWVIAIIIRIKTKKNLSLTETIAFIFSLLIFIAYFRTFGWYRYFFVAHIVTLIFTPSSVFIIYIFFKNHFKFFKKKLFAPLIAIFILIVFQFYQLGFNSWVADYYSSNKTHILSDYFSEFEKDKSVFFYNSPELIVFLPHNNYYQYLEITDSFLIGQNQIEKIQNKEPDIIVIKRPELEKDINAFTSYTIMGRIDRYILLEK